MEGMAFTDSSKWKWSGPSDVTYLELLGSGEYAPQFRSPLNIALIPEVMVGDFDLEVDLLQTGRPYGHRDMCLFFGFQSPAEFYYVHMATTPDANAHNVFRVANAPRVNLAPPAKVGVDWGTDVWHHVRVERRIGAGTIEIFWDGAAEPMLSVTDDTFGMGRIGFGSFDDSGRVTGVRIWAPTTSRSEGNPFAKSAGN
jgi:hypothetical protein